MMVAINRETGCVLHSFKKSLFYVKIEWKTYDRVKEIVSILKPLIL